MQMDVFAVKLPDETKAGLAALAIQRGVTMGYIVRELLRRELQQTK